MNKENVSAEKKASILKTLAIFGFIGLLGVIAWLSVQLVQLFPAAMSSLASLAEGVNEYQETVLDTEPDVLPLTVTANTSLINTNESITINWSEVRANGSYVFNYDCVDGVSLTHQSEVGERVIECATNYNVGDTNTLTVDITSEKNRYADVPYTVAFLRTNDTSPRAAGDSVVTVVNTAVSSQFAQAPNDEIVTPTEPSISVETNDPASEPETTAESGTNSTEPTAPTPDSTPDTYPQEFIFTVPVSDPNGFVDLSTSFSGMGEIINGAFVAGPVSVQNAGAVQFSVRNIGTKTSDDWTYAISLPTGSVFTSTDQTPLKPNERAVITIGFPAGATSPHTFVVSVDEPTDRRSNNDSFTETVTFAE